MQQHTNQLAVQRTERECTQHIDNNSAENKSSTRGEIRMALMQDGQQANEQTRGRVTSSAVQNCDKRERAERIRDGRRLGMSRRVCSATGRGQQGTATGGTPMLDAEGEPRQAAEEKPRQAAERSSENRRDER